MATREVTIGERDHPAGRVVVSARGDILAIVRNAGRILREETRQGDAMDRSASDSI